MTQHKWSKAEREMLEDALAGEPEALAKIQQSTNPELRAEFEALHDLTASLNRAGEDTRQEIAEALATPASAEERALTEAFLRRAQAQSKPRPKRNLVLWIAAAAVVLLAAGYALRGTLFDEPTGTGPTYLPGTDGLIQPIGRGQSFDTFSWEKGLSLGETYTVRVFDGDAPTDQLPRAIAEGEGIEKRVWRPTPDAQQKLRGYEHIRWELLRVDLHGEEHLVGSGEAWKKP